MIDDIKSCVGHGRRATDLEGEYMGSIAHEEVIKFSHNIGAKRTYVATLEIRHIKYVSAGDLLFSNIIV